MKSTLPIISTALVGAAAVALVLAAPRALDHSSITAAAFLSPLAANAPTVWPEVSSQDIELALALTGLNPESLAAAGLTAQDATDVVERVQATLVANPVALTAPMQAVSQAQAAVDMLEQRIQSGLLQEGDLAALTTARTNLTDAQDDFNQAVVDFVGAASVNLSGTQRALLTSIHSNRERSIPTQYLVESRTDAQWVALRDALEHEKQVNAGITPSNQSILSALEAVRSDTDVATASGNLIANLAAVQAATQSAAAN